jgi:clan AA aspartic protease
LHVRERRQQDVAAVSFSSGKSMGLIYGNFILRNARKRGLAAKTVRALVDTGANTLCIPPALAAELQLEEVEKRKVVMADGSKHWVPYVGPVQLSFDKRRSFGGAFVLGDEVLVGAIAFQDLDLIVAPALETALETVTVHPESSHIARGFAYGLRSRPHLKAPLAPVLSGT